MLDTTALTGIEIHGNLLTRYNKLQAEIVLKKSKQPSAYPRKNNVSLKVASGTSELKVTATPIIGLNLKKIHTTQTCIDRYGTWGRVVHDVTKERGQHPVYMPHSYVCTR